MAKKIRFNMLMDNHPVRDREELLQYFNIDDALAWYKNGLLTRWLAVRDLEQDIQDLNALPDSDDQILAQGILGVFFPDMSDADKHAATSHISFAQQRTQSLLALKLHDFTRGKVIADYHSGYKKILTSMLRNPTDYPLIKSALREIQMQYAELFITDFRRFFEDFQAKCILGVLGVMANPELRSMNLLNEDDMNSIFNSLPQINIFMGRYRLYQHITDDDIIIKNIENKSGDIKIKDSNEIEYDVDSNIYGKIINGLYFYSCGDEDKIEYIIVNNKSKNIPYSSFSGKTNEYWKDIEPSGKKYLLLSMQNGNLVRSAGKIGEELSANDINGKFPIVDGIDYKSNHDQDILVYLEA